MKAIAKETGLSNTALTTASRLGKWVQGSDLPKFEIVTRKAFIEMMAQESATPEAVARALADGILRPMEGQIIDDKGITIFEGVPDYKTRHKYIKEYLSTAGVQGKEAGPNIMAGDGGIVNIQVNLPAKSPQDD